MSVAHGQAHAFFYSYLRAEQGMSLTAGGSDYAYMLVASGANAYINGSVTYDLCIRAESHRILFSTNGGSSISGCFDGVGRWYTAGSINSEGQGRFKGWYNTSYDSVGIGLELGISSGEGYIYALNRTGITYVPLHVQASTIELVESTGTYDVTLTPTNGLRINTYSVATVQWGSSAPTSSTPGIVGGLYGVT